MHRTKNFYGYSSNNTFWNRKKNEWYNYHKQEAGDPDPYGWSNKELAEDLGYTVGAIQGWFSGRVVPGEKACEDICNFFDIDPEQGMGMFLKDHDDYIKAHNNPNQVTIEDVMNDSVPEDFLTWNKRDKVIHLFNVLVTNPNLNINHIGRFVLLFNDEISNKYRIIETLGKLYTHYVNMHDLNEFYEILRPYILLEKGQKYE